MSTRPVVVKKKDSGDAEKKTPDRKKPNTKRRGGAAAAPPDDADSVDSRGNLRGFIAYSDEEADAHMSTSSEEGEVDSSEYAESSSSEDSRPPKRKAALKARKKIQKKLAAAAAETEEDASPAAAPAPIKKLGKRLRKMAVESESEEEEEESEKPRRAHKARGQRRRSETSVSSSEESEEEDSEAEEDSDEDSAAAAAGPAGIVISFGGDDYDDERMVPKRHNMKKESDDVKRFVKLVTEPVEEGGIDDQIDEFKRLPAEKQKELLAVLDRRGAGAAGTNTTKQSMMFRILTMQLPPETQAMVLSKYNALQTMDPGVGEYYKQRAWLDKLTSLPLGIYKDIPVKLSDGAESCGAFMERARRCLADAIYGQEEAKMQILQFIATKIANPSARGLSLLLAGPPGIGKTSIIKNGIAKALDWPFQFVSLGGDSDASTYVGHQVVYEGSHCGKLANSLIASKSMSMVLMFDELDKISATPKGEEVQNLLVHLTDPVQNADFEDKYLSGIPLDLSRVLFMFSANDLNKIDRVLMDRMIVIELKGYSDKDKLAIAENFLLPAALREVGLDEKVSIGKEVLEHILKDYAREEQGVRELKRCVEAVVQKINMLRIFNAKDLPFHIPEFQLPFIVKKAHVDLFLKKKDVKLDPSIAHLYC
jgi:ATP-dependent Lon protease